MKRDRADVILLLSESEEEEAAPVKAHVRPPAAKRARSSKADAGAGPPAKKAAKAAAKPAAKQTTLKSKGFGALFLNASQGTDDGRLSQQPAAAKAKAAVTEDACDADEKLHDTDVDLWVDKHAPKTAEDLAVHTAKVTEVKGWLEGYLAYRRNAASRVLLITGPAGCGKSSTVRVLAADLGFDVVEWTPPVPVLWSEHQYQNMHDLQYHSKLDDFENFVARSKFAALQLTTSRTAVEGLDAGPSSSSQQPAPDTQQRSSSSQPSHQPPQQQGTPGPSSQQPAKHGKLLLVDDLPYVHDAERRQRLISSLRELSATSRCPVVIIATDSGGGGGGKGGGGSGSGGLYGAASGNVKGLHKDVVSALDSMGASTISFNPLTALNTAKALKRIAEQEGVELAPDTAAAISVAAAGDLRNAIGTLQMGFAGTAAARNAAKQQAKKSKAPSRKRGRAKKGDAAADAPKGGASASHVARDPNLSLFHALGKILHHKRQPPQPQAAAQAEDGAEGSGEADAQLQEASTSGAQAPHRSSRHRGPFSCDPDAVIQQSTLDATTIASFLQENYPHFISDDAIDDVAEAASYLSDAVLLACHRSNATTCGFWDEDDAVASTLQDAAAATVAARGLIYANAHPAPSRWLPLRGPASNAVERAATSNAARLSNAMRTTEGMVQCQVAQGSGGHVAAYVLPFLRLLAPWPDHAWLQRLLPRTWSFYWNGSVSERTSVLMVASCGPDSEVAAALQAASLARDEAAADGGAWDEIEDD